jgi:hypothetical protein
MTKYAVRLKEETKTDFLRLLGFKDEDFELDPEGNPITVWVTTSLSMDDLLEFEMVEDVVEANEQPPTSRIIHARFKQVTESMKADKFYDNHTREECGIEWERRYEILKAAQGLGEMLKSEEITPDDIKRMREE